MPVQEIRGLSGLKGWNQLTEEERSSWLEKHPKYKGLDSVSMIDGYANQTFVDTFGIKAFKSMSRADRDALYKEKVLNDAVKENFSDDDNYADIIGLTTQGKEELFNSDYFEKEALEEKRRQTVDNLTGKSKAGEIWDALNPTGLRAARRGVTKFGANIAEKKKDTILNDIIAKDNYRKDENSTNRATQVASSYKQGLQSGELTEDDINKAFNDIALGSKRTVNTPLGETEIENPGSRVYKAFKDAHEMSDFGLQDKIDFLSKYQATAEKYGEYAALQALETKLQDYVAEHQNILDYVSSAGMGVTTKMAANIMGIPLFIQSMSLANDPQALANFLEGKDKEGNPLPYYANPQYWNGVDQFASFSPEYIDKVREQYGGLSEYNWITPQGKEMSAAAAVNEGLKMAGYMAAGVVVSHGLGAISGGASAAASALGSEAVASAITKYAPYMIGAVNAAGISEAYGIGTYEQTLQEANALIDKRLSNDAQAYAESMIGENSGLKFENGVIEGTTKESNATAGLINEYVRSEVERILKENPDIKIDDINQEVIYADALSQYAEGLKRQYIQDHESDYAGDRDMARRSASMAYVTDAILEEARMSLANFTYRKFLMDPASRKALIDNSTKYRAFEEDGKLVGKTLRGSNIKAERYMAPLRSIWGGTRDNYLDDVTVAYAKGLGLSAFNNYFESELSPQEYVASTTLLTEILSGAADALQSAEKSMVDRQSFYDGLIGGVGSGLTFAPAFRQMASRGQYGKYANYDHQDLKLAAIERKKSLRDYVKDSNAVEEDIASGKVRKRTTGEVISDFIFNPLLREYSDAAEKEREFLSVIDVANKVISDNKPKVDEVVRFASLLNEKTLAEDGESLADVKDKKVKQAFEVVRMLDNAKNNPIYSQSSYLQEMRDKYTRLANGDITEQDIADFLNEPTNKSVKDDPNSQAIARERLQKNAQELAKMQEAYTDAMGVVRNSKDFGLIKYTNNAEKVATQLAFNTVMYDNRAERIAAMEQELRNTSQISEISSPIALYGSEKGRQAAEQNQQKLIDNESKRVDSIKATIDSIRESRSYRGKEKRYALEGLNLELQESQRRLSDLKAEMNNIKSAAEFDFNTTLSKEEIMALNPSERAKMLDSEHQGWYSSAQRKIVSDLRDELLLKDSESIDKIRDVATLSERNADIQKSNTLIKDNIIAAANYYNYAQTSRDRKLKDVWNTRLRNEIDDAIDSIQDDDTIGLKSTAKGYSFSVVDDYIKRHPERKEALEPIAKLLKFTQDARTVLDELYSGDAAKSNSMRATVLSLMRRDTINDVPTMMRALEDLAEGLKNTDAEKDWDTFLSRLETLNYLRDATRVSEREERRRKEREAAEKRETQSGEGDTPSGEGVNLFTKETPAQKTEEPELPPLPSTDDTIDSNGSVTHPDGDTVVKTAQNDATLTVEEPLSMSPEDSANAMNLDGVMMGNAMFEFDDANLVDSGMRYGRFNQKVLRLAGRRAIRKKGGALEAVYKWESTTGTNLQAIISDELWYVINDNPDTPIRFVKYNNSQIAGIDSVIFNAIEYTDNVRKYHDENNGGVVTIGDRQYLIVGTLGYNPSYPAMRDTFNAVSKDLTDSNNAGEGDYYISDKYSTKVDNIYAGRLVDAYDEASLLDVSRGNTRTLKSLLENRATNPHELSYEDMMFGIMFTKKGFVLYRQGEQGRTVYPPRSIENNIGGTFLMIPTANGNYLPVALEPASITSIPEDSRLYKNISDVIDSLLAPDRKTRENGLKQLSHYLVFSKGTEEVTLTGDTVNVVRNEGNTTLSFDINDLSSRNALKQAILKDTPFRVNVSPQVVQNPTLLKIYDDAGALRTTAAKLGTVNASYTVLMVDSNGKPIEKAQPTSDIHQTNIAPKVSGTTVSLSGVEYTLTDNGTVYDSTGKEVSESVATKVYIANYMATQNPSPEYTTSDGKSSYYRISRSDGTSIIVLQRENGALSILDNSGVERYNTELEKKRREDNAREVVKNTDSDSSTTGNKNTKTQVLPTESSEKVFNFTTEIRNTNSRTYGAVSDFLSTKGLDADDMTPNEIKDYLKKNNISFETVTNEDSFIEMLNNCK